VKIAHSLHLIIWQFNAEMLLEAREHFERLEAIESELFVKIVFGQKGCARHFELLRREAKYFVGGLFDGAHIFTPPAGRASAEFALVYWIIRAVPSAPHKQIEDSSKIARYWMIAICSRALPRSLP
jgi:hypothetical protein